MGFGTFQLEQDTVTDMVSATLAEGLRHIDTAQAYENEEQVGAGLRRADVRRDDVFLTTKILHEHFAPNAFIAAAVLSLKRLGTDYVDLLLLH
jgi:diketogulonate reductase-like aldo/keto reductase